MLNPYTRAWIEIDTSLIKHNIDEIKKYIGKTKIMAIVKANAYGHGSVMCAKALQAYGIDFFGVACIEEAILLRKNGITQNILILGYTSPNDFSLLIEYDIVQTICSFEYAKKLNGYACTRHLAIRTHLNVDTGMNRIGIPYQETTKHYEEIKACYQMKNLHVEGIYSHFAVADECTNEHIHFTKTQLKLYQECIEKLKNDRIHYGLTHIQNSYGILNYGDLNMDYCRPGLLCLGITSNQSIKHRLPLQLRPILELYSTVSVVKTIEQGSSVGYGRSFIATKTMRIATITIGYADGLLRGLSNQNVKVLLHDKQCSIIGNICMDQCMIDVSNVQDVKEGDEVILIAKNLPIDRISTIIGTINNESLCMLSTRLKRLPKRQKVIK